MEHAHETGRHGKTENGGAKLPQLSGRKVVSFTAA